MTSRLRRPRSLPKQPSALQPPVRKRSAADLAQYSTELELELTRLRTAMAQQKREFEEESASFPQVLARLAHSERALGQTKTKLIAADEAAERADSQLSSLRARLHESEAKLQERADQERALRTELSSLRAALAAAQEREPSFQHAERELQAELGELREALALSNQQRDELVVALAEIELLAQRIGRIGREQGKGAEALAAAEPESEDKRVTLRPVPVAPLREPPRSLRRGTPEILVDGVPLAR
jgi:chromosome segregation ATPase